MSNDSMLFPQKLMDILADPFHQGIISWLPDGKSFVIRDRTLFAEIVLPKYFSRKAKYSSFTRKLNRWNFMRVANGPEPGAYFHKYFLRDQPHLAAQMFCKNARTMLAMKSSTSESILDTVQNEDEPKSAAMKETRPPMAVAASPLQTPLLSSAMWSMKMQSTSALTKSHFSASTVPATASISSSAGLVDRQALLMQQEKEQLNRMLIERTLRQQQRSNAVMQQDRLLQMRRMIEINMLQHRLQQQQKIIAERQQQHQQGNNNGASQVTMNNRASAA